MILLAVYGWCLNGQVEAISDSSCWINLILLGLVPTALSNICVTASLKLIDSTIVAILGAFEPLTAMVVGIVFLGDPYCIISMTGAALILFAVALLTVFPKLLKKYRIRR